MLPYISYAICSLCDAKRTNERTTAEGAHDNRQRFRFKILNLITISQKGPDMNDVNKIITAHYIWVNANLPKRAPFAIYFTQSFLTKHTLVLV